MAFQHGIPAPQPHRLGEPVSLFFPTGLPSCLFQPTVFVPHAHWEAYGLGSLPLHNLVSDSAKPHYVSDPLPCHCGIIVALDSSEL